MTTNERVQSSRAEKVNSNTIKRRNNFRNNKQEKNARLKTSAPFV